MPSDPTSIRPAGAGDAEAIGRLLHDFNAEFDEPAPDPPALAARVRELIARDDFAVLLAGGGLDGAGDGPDGLAILRFRPSIWSAAEECYLAELYVVPGRRGNGLGRALMDRALAFARERGADHVDLGTSETDTAARALYESLGFANREGGPDGPTMLYYEREL